MKTKIFYKQMGRSFRTLLTNVLILLVVTAFFTMSLNLYNSSKLNLARAADTYSTIAVMELYGDVDRYGNLTTPESDDYVGSLSVAVKDYDIEKFVSASGVLDYDLRARYAAYIEGKPAISSTNADIDLQTFIVGEDIIRFTLERDEPVTIPINWSEDYPSYNRRGSTSTKSIYLNVLASAAELLGYRQSQFLSRGIKIGAAEIGDTPERNYYADQVRQLNRTDDVDYVTLYPGVEYIAVTKMRPGWEIREESHGLYVGNQEFFPNFLRYFSTDISVP